MTQTAGPFGTSSSAVKKRPRAGTTPSVAKNAPLVRSPESCSGSPVPVTVKLSNALMPNEANDWTRSRRNSNRGHETDAAGALSCGLLLRTATSVDGEGSVVGLSTSRS